MDHYNKSSPQEYLTHHGIKGQRWGIRRYQNKDGTLTPAGKRRAAKYEKNIAEQKQKLNQRKASLSDIEKNGLKSDYIKTLYGDEGKGEVTAYLKAIGDYSAKQLILDAKMDEEYSIRMIEDKIAKIEAKMAAEGLTVNDLRKRP